jgi:hypothetical protein
MYVAQPFVFYTSLHEVYAKILAAYQQPAKNIITDGAGLYATDV